MKRKSYTFLKIIILIIIIVSCKKENEEKYEHIPQALLDERLTEDEQELTISDNEWQEIVLMYLNILENKVKYFHYINFYNFFGNSEPDDMYNGEYKTLNEYIKTYSDNNPEIQFSVNEFTVLDIDGDGIPDVIINIRPVDDRILLHFKDGTVFGYTFGIRGLNGIMKDGTFGWSNGAFDSGYSKLNSISGVLETQKIDNFYEYDLNSREEVEWYSYSIENVLQALLNIWEDSN